LIIGGRDGEFFREMEDYFYYAQIKRFTIFTSFLQLYVLVGGNSIPISIKLYSVAPETI